MITIVTLLRGNPTLSRRWADAIALQRPEGSQIFAGVTNQDDAELVESMGGRVFWTVPYPGTDELGRINHVCGIYAMILPQVTTEHVVLWEDDILPPPTGIKKLIADAVNAPVITSVVPFRKEQQTIPGIILLMLFYKEVPSAVTLQHIPKEGLDEIFYGGSAFSIWETSVIQDTLPWQVTEEAHGTIPGWDEVVARQLAAEGKKTMVDLAIRCYHG